MKCLIVWIHFSLVSEHFFCIFIGYLFFYESLTHQFTDWIIFFFSNVTFIKLISINAWGFSRLHILFHLWNCQFLFQLFIVLCSSLVTLSKIYWLCSWIILPMGLQKSCIKVVRNTTVKWTNELGAYLTFKNSFPIYKYLCLSI